MNACKKKNILSAQDNSKLNERLQEEKYFVGTG